MSEIKVRVRARKVEADGICSFELEPVGADLLPTFEAGAHIDVHVPTGLVRQYSLCSSTADRSFWRIGVLREPASRGGSIGMHDTVQIGSLLKVSMPKNLFALTEAKNSILVAGGIGVTPIWAMAQHLHRNEQAFQMHYCARSRERMAFFDEIRAAGFADQTRFYFSEEPDTPQFDAAAVFKASPAGSHLYVCGPAGFMDYVLDSARKAGWPEERLHREHFAGAVQDTSGDQPFQLRLARSGTCFDVPSGVTALQVLLDNGIDMNFSCESGVCGTCLTSVLEGTPDHRDTYLTDSERTANDAFTPCCSRAKTPSLVLDL
jgi:vanillate monooxygenase ferredoxin subunit